MARRKNKPSVTFKYKPGARIKNIKPPTLGEVVLKLTKQHGGTVTAEQLLEYGTPKNSPIHKGFTWDDTKAAHQHRLAEARQMLQAIVIVTDEEEDIGRRPVRYFHDVGNGNYAGTFDIQRDAGQTAFVKKSVLALLQQALDKCQGFEEYFGDLRDDINALLMKYRFASNVKKSSVKRKKVA